MKYNAGTLVNLALMGVAVGVVIVATKWPLRTALFPITIAIMMICIAIGELFLDFIAQEETTGKKRETELPPLETSAELLPTRGLLWGSAWTLGFFLLIILLGFPMSVPLFTFLYLKLHGRESWGISIGLAVLALACFTVLFVQLLHIPFQEGWVQKGLRLFVG